MRKKENEESDLSRWWMKTSAVDCVAAVKKQREYGSRDLVAVDRVLLDTMKRDGEPTGELGCWFYLEGKMARAFEAIRDGRQPSDDTVHDLVVYAMMIRRIRQHGSWS